MNIKSFSRFFVLLICAGVMAIFISAFISACSPKPDAVDVKGNPIRLSAYHGKWVFVNFWASWCEPCVTEMPALDHLYRDHKDQLVVLGVNFDGASVSDIQKVIQKRDLHYPILAHFPLEKLGVQNVDVLPTTFVINPQGKVVKVLKGPQTEQGFLKVLSGKANPNRQKTT